ncbi:TRP-like family [Phytophthora cinnamomi]|nr:TRP-like family [Phytophthora cinnamomi]
MFAMTGSFFISEGSSNASANGSSSRFALGIAALAAVVLLALGLGIIVVGNNTDELKDVGTYEHDQRAFSSKYSAYYDEYNFDNRFFFVPRILLAILTGAVVGIVRDATTQLLCILALTMVYLILLLIRQPNLLRFLYYIGIASVFMKVVLICLMLIVARDDYFPQSVRDNVAYGIIGVNMFIFFLLFVRQAYTIIHKMVVSCRHKKNGKDNGLDATDINLEFGNNTSTNARTYEQVESTPAGHEADWYEKQQQQHQLNQAQQYPPQQYQSQQYQAQQYQSQTSTMSGYSTTQSSRSGHSDHVPMLEPAPEPVPASNRSRGNIRPPISRNQQYSFGGSMRSADAFEVNNAAAAPAPEPVAQAPIPTYDVLAAYLGTNKTVDETAYSTSPRSGRGQSSRGQHLSSRGQNSSRGQHLSSRGQNSSRGLPSSRDPPSSRGQSSRGGAALSASGLGSRPSTVPLDAYAGSFSGTDSGVSNSSSRRRHKDIDIDDVDIDDDIVAAPPVSSTARQQFAPGASTMSHHFAPGASTASSVAMMEQSYVNFSDSMISSASSQMGMTQASIKPDNTFSAAMGAAGNRNGGYGSSPQAKMSIFSNDSENSFDGDSSGWFKERSKTAVSVESSDTNGSESRSYELGPLGVTTSAFSIRDSVDSYGYQSTANFASSHVDFNAQSKVTNNGSDDGRYYPTHRRGTGSSNQSSNQSFLSSQSDDSMGVDGEKVRYDDHNTLTL